MSSRRSRRTSGAGVMAGAAARLTSRLGGFVRLWCLKKVVVMQRLNLLDVLNGVGGDKAGRGEDGKLEEKHVDGF